MDPTAKWFDDYKFVAVIRSSSTEDAEEMIKAASLGGIRIFEISMQTPQATRLLETYSKKEGFLFGAGFITDGEMAQRANNAGAKFLSSQYADRDIITVAKNNDNFVIQGAMTPTEVISAYQQGADLVRVFPASVTGGADYLRLLRSIYPFVKLMADGGVTYENFAEYLKHSVAVSLRKALFDKPLIRTDNWAQMTERAKLFTQKLEALKVAK